MTTAENVIALTKADPAARAALEVLAPLGRVYAVGGVVRDVVLGTTPKDVDLLVQGVPQDDVLRALRSMPGAVALTGERFGVLRYRIPSGGDVEIALPRAERSTGPKHRDFEIYIDHNLPIEEDLARRDFTGNAMAVDLIAGSLVDNYGGAADLRAGVLRVVSERSFLEDPLRILRAFVLVSRYGLVPIGETWAGMKEEAPSLVHLPQERVRAELDKILVGPNVIDAITLMEAAGVFAFVLPEIEATIGFDQRSKYHALVLNEHQKEVLRLIATQSDDRDLRWAALMHDVGKVPTQWFDDEGYGHFYASEDGRGDDHEIVGAEMTRKAFNRLKFSNDRIDRVVHLVRWHMFAPFSGARGARRFMNRVGNNHVDDLLLLRWADSGGKDKANEWDGSVAKMQNLVAEVREAREPTDKSMLVINGHDLIADGHEPGPQMGRIFDHLVECVLENPALNTRESLLVLARAVA